MRPKICCVAVVLTLLAVAPPCAAAPRGKAEPAQIIDLLTKDGVTLKITYYQSPGGKDSAVVVLLPDLKDSRGLMTSMATRLQSPGPADAHKPMAAVTVDLRGHGDSVSRVLASGRTGEISASRLRKSDYVAMVLEDMEAVRRFLVEKNDSGELNLNRLAIVGAGLGASVATNWAARDWSAPPLAVGKQGQDVKTLVLVSPRWNFNGLTMQDALRQRGVASDVAFMILYGNEDRKAASDAQRVYDQLARSRPAVSPDSKEPSDLMKVDTAETRLQGTQFMKQGGAQVEDLVIRFISKHTVEPNYPWTDRP
ncbi:Alpha/beta hydrolase family protein [Pirellulimonas nuda]|uniref:Alpha/beta hydrolase family protein n=1 Tax=Pirellulimonas nuda TaxID=2528009 RepID=A0A518D9L2_9BACT|nr:alpha/beta hydrolase [Pirellulimonas nuda]QDU88123.1 Alpha/beta hydrolase family protein [Pirellulimonas nuda]